MLQVHTLSKDHQKLKENMQGKKTTELSKMCWINNMLTDRATQLPHLSCWVCQVNVMFQMGARFFTSSLSFCQKALFHFLKLPVSTLHLAVLFFLSEPFLIDATVNWRWWIFIFFIWLRQYVCTVLTPHKMYSSCRREVME